MTWSGCASSSTGSATAPRRARELARTARTAKARPGRRGRHGGADGAARTARSRGRHGRQRPGGARRVRRRPVPGSPRAGRHRQGRRAAVRARRARQSFLRRKLLGARLGGPSLPLDIGYSDTVPAGIRNAVRLRDRHCEWAGGCDQPASACQVHHTRHKANGGKTSLKDCVLLCHYHHQVMIHRLGWTLIVNPDGTTTAWNKDKTKVLHSHGPPARAG